MSDLSCRDFIKQIFLLGAFACCFGAASLTESCSTTSKVASDNNLNEKPIVEKPGEITITKAAFGGQPYIKVNSGKFAEPIFVNTNPDGTYSAVLMHCTYKSCALNASQGKFVCPCHGCEFDLAGHVLKGPAKSDLQTFQVTTDENHVILSYQ